MKTNNLALAALAIGGLCIGTTEFATMGLLPFIASGLGISVPRAGYVVSAYAFGVVVGAPLLTIIAAKWDRKKLLLFLMLFYSLSNALSAFAPSLGVLVFCRFLSGLPHGAFFGVGAVMGVHAAGQENRGRAVAIMMIGLTVANIFGVPLVTLAGRLLGWRLSYVGMSALGFITLGCLALWLPKLPVDAQSSVVREIAALRNVPLWIVFVSGAVGFGGMFAVYSFVSPLMTETAGLAIEKVPLILSLFGIGMTVGAFFGGRFSDRSIISSIVFGFAVTSFVLVALGLFSHYLPVAVAGIFALGVFSQFINIPLQAMLMDLSPSAPSLGAALCHSALNVANALGALFASMALSAGLGNHAPSWVGLAMTLAGGAIFLFGVRSAQKANFRIS